MRATLIIYIMILAAIAPGCQSQSRDRPTIPSPATPSNPDGSQAAAYIDGVKITRDTLYRRMVESAGGEALAEWIIDRAIEQRLGQAGITLSQADLDAEKEQLLANLSPAPDDAARLLAEMRSRRGLGTERFDATLRRSAGLRRLVRDGVNVTDSAIQQAYAMQYGPRYRVRLITADTAGKLADARRRVINGESFTDLAIQLSTDASAAQGGLLSPFTAADPTYPKSIRQALPSLTTDSAANRLSPAIALADGYALLWLEEVTQPEAPAIQEVREALADAVRIEAEQLRMRQLARAILEQADVVVVDPALGRDWQRRRETITDPP